jgi:hypothetical protein
MIIAGGPELVECGLEALESVTPRCERFGGQSEPSGDLLDCLETCLAGQRYAAPTPRAQ